MHQLNTSMQRSTLIALGALAAAGGIGWCIYPLGKPKPQEPETPQYFSNVATDLAPAQNSAPSFHFPDTQQGSVEGSIKLANGSVISNEEWRERIISAERAARDAMRQTPRTFDLTKVPIETRPFAAIEAAQILAETEPEHAFDLLWPLETTPGLLAMGYEKVFSSWYRTAPEDAAVYLLKQNLSSEKWCLAAEKLAQDWSKTSNDLFPDLIQALPVERRDDVLISAVGTAAQSSMESAQKYAAMITDPEKKRAAETWINRRSTK